MKVSVAAAWLDDDDRAKFIAEIKEKYGHDIECTFTDGSDYDSSWTFNGPENIVKRIVEDNFQFCPEYMPFDILITHCEVNGHIDGKCMWEC